MPKALPHKPFYGLAEICARWSLQEADIASYVLEGELTLSIPVAGLRVDTFEDEEDCDGRHFRMPTGTRCITGTMDLSRVDTWTIMQHGSQPVAYFYGAAPGECFELPDKDDQPGALVVERQALVVRRAEMERFEELHGIGDVTVVAGDAQEGRSRKKSRGAPPRYDWDSFWVEIINTTWPNGAPRTQAEMVQQLLDWFATKLGPDNVPSESSVKQRLMRVWPTIKPDVGRPSALTLVNDPTGRRAAEKTRTAAR